MTWFAAKIRKTKEAALKPRVVKKLDAAWSAGVIDGEGCITILFHPARVRYRTLSDRYQLVLKVTMCCQKTVSHLYELFGVGSTSSHIPKKGVRESISFSWTCNVRQAEYVLGIIRPYLITKADEADVALEFLTLPLAKRGGRKGSKQIPSELQAARKSCFLRIRALKTRSRFKGKNKVGRKPTLPPEKS